MSQHSDDAIQHLKPTFSAVLESSPSCIEFCPGYTDLFVVGLYTLEDASTQARSGSLMLFLLRNDNVTMLQDEHQDSAVLDLKFHPKKKERFAAALSGGQISLHVVERGFLSLFNSEIESKTLFTVFEESDLVLSLAWHHSSGQILGASLSTGAVVILQFSPEFENVTVLHKVAGPHSELAWTMCWTPSIYSPAKHPLQGLYSGGDDARLRCVTFKIKPDKDLQAATQAATPGGRAGMAGHGAGVTAILPLPLGTQAGQDILVTGSYDEKVRVYAVYDHRPGDNTGPKVLAEANLGDGVWRLQFLRNYNLRLLMADIQEDGAGDKETRSFRVLASCMRAGAIILEVTGSLCGEWKIEVLGQYVENETLCYASAVQPARPYLNIMERLDDRSVVCISTSFYEKLLTVWRYQDEEGSNTGSD